MPLRSTITDQDGVLEILIPLRFRPFRFLFLAVFSLVWGIAIPIGVWKIVTTPSPPLTGYLFAALFFALWVVFEPLALQMWACTIVGRDRVRVTGKTLEIRCEAFGLGGFWNRYPLRKIREVGSIHNLIGSRACIAAQNSTQRITFGEGLDAAEADFLAQRIREAFARASAKVRPIER